MNRRSFLSLLGAGTAAMVLDPELALWKPGAKTIFLPPKKPPAGLLFHKDAFTLSSPADGISLRMVREYDILRDADVVRLDVLYGWQVLRPELLCVIKADHTVDAARYGEYDHQAAAAAAARDLARRIDEQALDYAYSKLGLKLKA